MDELLYFRIRKKVFSKNTNCIFKDYSLKGVINMQNVTPYFLYNLLLQFSIQYYIIFGFTGIVKYIFWGGQTFLRFFNFFHILTICFTQIEQRYHFDFYISLC